uniref:Uncharacterized protein n=1 Tax=Anguilla anguilla TaxID=7936 RepID=A0A0E9Q784_ANGAN
MKTSLFNTILYTCHNCGGFPEHFSCHHSEFLFVSLCISSL